MMNVSYYPLDRHQKLSHLKDEILYIDAWLSTLEAHDKGAKDHSYRVANVALSFAIDLSVEEEKLPEIYQGALLHDIGKLFIPHEILSKPGKLNDREWSIMRHHPEFAYQFLSNIVYLQKAITIPYLHHERWNGSGYPCGLEGKDIPIAARLFAIVDVWDSLSYDRCYNAAWPHGKISAYIQEQAGNLFDPELAEQFLSHESKYRKA